MVIELTDNALVETNILRARKEIADLLDNCSFAEFPNRLPRTIKCRIKGTMFNFQLADTLEKIRQYLVLPNGIAKILYCDSNQKVYLILQQSNNIVAVDNIEYHPLR